MPTWLLDTNVLLRALHPADPQHELARTAVLLLRRRGDDLCVTLQGLSELWNVCTRPISARGGFGISLSETDRRVRLVERIATFLPDDDSVRLHWRRIVVTHGVQGVQVHDARLVASMLAHSATHLLTFNGGDFSRYPGVVAAHPQEVLDGNL